MIGGLLASAAPVAAAASECDAVLGNLVTNCGFETGNFTGWTQGGNTGFTSVTTNPNYVHSGTSGARLGPVGSDGTLSQLLATQAGHSYQLGFYVRSDGGAPSHFEATLTDGGPPVTVVDLHDTPFRGWTHYTYSFTAETAVTFSFRHAPAFWGLDDVSVVEQGISALSPVHAWVGLRNSDDQGTSFDVRAELLLSGVPVASGLARCVTGVTRNPSLAKEVVINWDPFTPFVPGPSDYVQIRLSTRIGTTPSDAKCPGHNNAVGLRLYYDGTSRASRFDATNYGLNTDAYLHSDGTVCVNSASSGVTTRTFDETAPTSTNPKCVDSPALNFNGANGWRVIGTWSPAA